MTYALDASAIIAHLDGRDAHHGAAGDVLDRAIDDRLVAHALTVAECLVAAVRAGRGVDMLDAIRGMGAEEVGLDDGTPLRLAELRVATGLRMPDCCALDAAQVHGATLITFDGRLAAAGRRLALSVEPPGDPSS